jgi:hypothetical protein
MDNVKIVEIEGREGVETHVIIDRGNNEFTSMPKFIYDTLVSELPDAATKKAK